MRAILVTMYLYLYLYAPLFFILLVQIKYVKTQSFSSFSELLFSTIFRPHNAVCVHIDSKVQLDLKYWYVEMELFVNTPRESSSTYISIAFFGIFFIWWVLIYQLSVIPIIHQSLLTDPSRSCPTWLSSILQHEGTWKYIKLMGYDQSYKSYKLLLPQISTPLPKSPANFPLLQRLLKQHFQNFQNYS